MTIAAGATSGTAPLIIRDDTDVETNEVVVIEAASGDLAGATLNVTIVDNDEAIGTPTALRATPGDGTLALAWTAPATGTATGYGVEYKLESAASWVAVDRGTETSPPATSETISGLTNDADYDVRVRAIAAGGRSLWTTAGGTPSALNALAKPTNFALAAGDGKITARWQDVTNADHYVLWYGVAGSGTTEKVTLGDVTSHTVSGLVNGSELPDDGAGARLDRHPGTQRAGAVDPGDAHGRRVGRRGAPVGDRREAPQTPTDRMRRSRSRGPTTGATSGDRHDVHHAREAHADAKPPRRQRGGRQGSHVPDSAKRHRERGPSPSPRARTRSRCA